MISIRRYLNTDPKQPGGKGDDDALRRFASGILAGIHDFALTGDAAAGLRSRLIEVKDTLGGSLTSDEAAFAAQTVCSILESHFESSKLESVDKLVEAQHIFAMLNQALVVLVEGSDRDVSRLVTIQESLQRTARMRDVASMKESLEQTVRFVQAEYLEAREAASGEVSRLKAEVASARELFENARLELAGRPEGVGRISESLKNVAEGQALYVVAYFCDRLAAVTQRYGPGVSEELMSRLIRERLKPLMTERNLYRWTASSLVAVFSRPRDEEKLRREIAELNRTPLVHKMALNGRTAVLTVSPAYLVAEGAPGGGAALIEQVDKFTLANV